MVYSSFLKMLKVEIYRKFYTNIDFYSYESSFQLKVDVY